MEKNEKHEEHFYKGLFFGLLIGLCAAWFSQTKKGKEIVREAKEKINEAFSEKLEDLEDEDEVDIKEDPKPRAKKPLRKFFKK